MKYSRKIVISLLLLAALFCAGAVLGSHLPNVTIYISIAVSAIVATIFIVFGYTGHSHTAKKKVAPTTQPKKERPASSEATDGGFTDVYSGR